MPRDRTYKGDRNNGNNGNRQGHPHQDATPRAPSNVNQIMNRFCTPDMFHPCQPTIKSRPRAALEIVHRKNGSVTQLSMDSGPTVIAARQQSLRSTVSPVTAPQCAILCIRKPRSAAPSFPKLIRTNPPTVTLTLALASVERVKSKSREDRRRNIT